MAGTLGTDNDVAYTIPNMGHRYGAFLDRVALNAPYALDPSVWSSIAEDLRDLDDDLDDEG